MSEPTFLQKFLHLGVRAKQYGREFLARHKTTTNYRGFTIEHPPNTGLFNRLRTQPIYEEKLAAAIAQELQKHDKPVYFDIGANVGLMIANVLSTCPHAKIHAFEPSPSVRDYLLKTIALNSFMQDVHLHKTALGSEEGTCDFAMHDPRHASGDGFADTGRAGKVRIVQVPVTTLDHVCARAGVVPHVLKIDVEGAEYFVLGGAKNMLRAYKPVIFFEAHPDNLRAYQHNLRDVWQILLDAGYEIFTLTGELVPIEQCRQMSLTVHDYIARPKAG